MKIFSLVLPSLKPGCGEGVDTVQDRLRKSRMIRVLMASSVVRMKRERERERERERRPDQRRRENGGISGPEVGGGRSWTGFRGAVTLTYLRYL